MTTSKPELPRPIPVDLKARTTALLILDLAEVCADPKQVCHKLAPGLTNFLVKTRRAGVFTAFTVSAHMKGQPMGKVYSGFNRQPSEPELFPDGYNKFTGGELQAVLPGGLDTLVITGYRSNIAVLYTATYAARDLKYKVVIPLDGNVALTDYEYEYTHIQFTVLPGGVAERFTFSALDMITFR